MSQIIERIARALSAADGRNPDAILGVAPEPGSFPAADIATPAWQGYVDKARAAIVAMREPTDDLLEAGAFYFGDNADPGPTREAEYNLARSCFRSMLEVALRE
jgi:hypothetical protein